LKRSYVEDTMLWYVVQIKSDERRMVTTESVDSCKAALTTLMIEKNKTRSFGGLVYTKIKTKLNMTDEEARNQLMNPTQNDDDDYMMQEFDTEDPIGRVFSFMWRQLSVIDEATLWDKDIYASTSLQKIKTKTTDIVSQLDQNLLYMVKQIDLISNNMQMSKPNICMLAEAMQCLPVIFNNIGTQTTSVATNLMLLFCAVHHKFKQEHANKEMITNLEQLILIILQCYSDELGNIWVLDGESIVLQNIMGDDKPGYMSLTVKNDYGKVQVRLYEDEVDIRANKTIQPLIYKMYDRIMESGVFKLQNEIINDDFSE